MDGLKKSKGDTIEHIFKTMDYGSDLQDVSKATEWLKTKESRLFAHVNDKKETPNGQIISLKNAISSDESLCDIYSPEANTVHSILQKVGETKNVWRELPPLKRTELIYKFGSEIQKHGDTLVQLEVVARGILSKDTKNKSLQLLTDYLHYYSSFTVNCGPENSECNPQGIAVAILSDENPIFIFGLILGPALAYGYQIILQTGPRLSPVVAYLLDLAAQINIPEGTVRLIPGNVERKIFFTHPKVSLISIFDDLRKEEYFIVNQFSKKLINFYSSGIPMIVFDNSDLDAACQAVTDAAWGCKGMLPWSVRNVLIQEDIFENFVQKVKQSVGSIKVGTANKKNVDISFPTDTHLDKLTKMVERAKSEGVEVYQPNPTSVVPTILIGGNVFNNNVIKEDNVNVPILALTAFRTINEAVTLSNNTRQGLAVSVWTENTSLVNELVRKLKVSNIWINCHGQFAVDVAMSPYKSSGNSYFGGLRGFYEYDSPKTLKQEDVSQTQSANAMEKAIAEAKRAQDSWSKSKGFDRMKHMIAITQNIDSIKKTLSLPDKWFDDWVTLIIKVCNLKTFGGVTIHPGFNIITMREPYGVIAVETLEDINSHNKKLIVASLLEGNCVIILNDSSSAVGFYNSISKILPKGVLSVVAHSQDASKVAALHQELDLYFGERSNNVFRTLPLKDSCKFRTVNHDNWNEVWQESSLVKNVWFNVGQSFI